VYVYENGEVWQGQFEQDRMVTAPADAETAARSVESTAKIELHIR